MGMNRRAALGLGAAGVVAATAASCSTSHNTGSNIGQSVGNINDLTQQQNKLTIAAYNHVWKDPECQYPAGLLTTSLEMRNLRKKLLLFNEPTKTGWLYFVSQGKVLCEIPVMGKVSSTQSSMTTTDSVYSTNDSGGVEVSLPADDISFGPNEGGDSGIFFFTVDGVLIQAGGMGWIYSDAKLNVLDAMLMQYPPNSRPSSTVAPAKPGDGTPLASPLPSVTIS